MQTNAKVNPPSATAVWNVTVVITEACKQNVDNVCQMTSYGVSPAGIFDADMSDAPYTTDDSGDNIRLKVSKDTDSSAAVEIDPNLLQTLYDFSLACAETGQCPPSPADFSGTAAEWARQYVAATNAQYPTLRIQSRAQLWGRRHAAARRRVHQRQRGVLQVAVSRCSY